MDKRCIKCGEVLPLSKFPTNRRMPDGHLGWCFDCFATRDREVGRAIKIVEEVRNENILDPTTNEVLVVKVSYDADGKPINPGRNANTATRRGYKQAYKRWRYAEEKRKRAEARKERGISEEVYVVQCDADGKPMRPPREGRTPEAMYAYKLAYNRWYTAQRKANDPDYNERYNAWKRDWRAKMAERGELKIRTARYCKAWRERHPERYEEVKRKKREAYHEKKSQKVLEI